MELELGLKVTRTREDVSSSVDFRFSKDPFGPLVLSQETDSRFIIIIHLKGFKKEGIEIEINKEGDRITIRGRKPVEEMVMIRWMAWRKEIKARFDDDDATLTITMPKRVKGISGFNLEQEVEEEEEEEAEGDVSKVENREVEEDNVERETQREEGFGEMMEDKERESQVSEGEGFSGGVDEEEAQIEDDDLEMIQEIDEQHKILESSEEEIVGEKELADSDSESEDSGFRKLPGIIEQEDNQEVMEQKVSEETKRDYTGSGAIEGQESDEDSGLENLPDIKEQKDNQEGREHKVSEETESDDNGSGAVEEIEEEESDEDSGLKKLPDIIEQEDSQEVMEQKVSEDAKSDDIVSGAVEEIEEQESDGNKIEEEESDEDSGLKKLPDIIEQEDSQEVMEQKVSEDAKSDDIVSGAVEEIEEQESDGNSGSGTKTKDSGLENLPDIIGQEDNQKVREQKVSEETKSDDNGSEEVEENEEQESDEDSGLKNLTDMIEQEDKQEVMEQKVSEETKSDDIVSGAVEEIEEQESGGNSGSDTKTKDSGPEKLPDIIGQEDNQKVREQKVSEETRSDDNGSEEVEENEEKESDEDSGLKNLPDMIEQEDKQEVMEQKVSEETKSDDIRSEAVEEIEEQESGGNSGSDTKTKDSGSEKLPDIIGQEDSQKVSEQKVSEETRSDDNGSGEVEEIEEQESDEDSGLKELPYMIEQEDNQEVMEQKVSEETKSDDNGSGELEEEQESDEDSGLKELPYMIEQEDNQEVMEQKVSEGTRIEEIGCRAVEEIEEQESDEIGRTSISREIEKKKSDAGDGLRKAQGIEEPERHNEERKIQEMVEEETGGQEKDAKEESDGKETQIEDDNLGKSHEEETVGQHEFSDSDTTSEGSSSLRKPPNIFEQENKQDEMEKKDSQADTRSDEKDAKGDFDGKETQIEDDNLGKSHEEETVGQHEFSDSDTTSEGSSSLRKPPNIFEQENNQDVMEQKDSQAETKSDSRSSEEIEKQEPHEQLDGTSKSRATSDDDGLNKVQGTEEPERRNEESKMQEMVRGDPKEDVDAEMGEGFTPNIERTPVVAETETKDGELESKKTVAENVEKKHDELVEKKEEKDRRSFIKLQENEEQHSSVTNDVPKPVQETEAPEMDTLVKTNDEEKEKKKSREMEKKNIGEGFAPNIAETKKKPEDFESEKQGAGDVDKIHKLVEKKKEEDANVRAKGEDRRSLIKLQENEEQHSKGRKGQDKQENIKELLEEKAPEADTEIVNDIQKPVKEIEVPEVGNGEDRRSLIKLQENEEQHSKGRKGQDKQENIKELLEEKAPEADTEIVNDIQKPVKEIEVPEVGTLEETGDEGKEKKNIVETERKPEDFECDKLGADEVDKKDELVEQKKEEEDAKNDEAGPQSSSIKPQGVGEQLSQGQKRHEKTKELVEEKTPEAEKAIEDDTPKRVQEETKDTDSRKPQENIRQQELDECERCEKESKNQELTKINTNDEEKDTEETITKEQDSYRPNVVGEEKEVQELAEEKPHFSKNRKLKEEEKVPEKKTELGDDDDDISRKAGDSDEKEEVDYEMGKGFAPNIAETVKKTEDFEFEKLGADEVEKIHKLVEKKEEEDDNARAKGEDRRSLLKMKEDEEPHSKARKRQDIQENIKQLVEEKAPEAETDISNDILKPVQEIKQEVSTLGEAGDEIKEGKEKKKSESLEVTNRDAKKETDLKMGVAETKPEEFESDQLKADKIHEPVEKKKEEEKSVGISLIKTHEVGEQQSQGQMQEGEHEMIEELVEEKIPGAETNISNDTSKPVEERGEGRQKIPKLFQEEETKKQPEEHKEKMVETGEKIDDAVSREVQEIIRQQDLDEAERCEKESKTQEVVKSKRNDEEKGAGETEIEEQESYGPKILWDEESAEKKSIDDAVSREVQEIIRQQDLDEAERCEKESKNQELTKINTNDEEKGAGETEIEEQESYGPKILWDEESAEKKSVFDAEERDLDSREEVDVERGKGFTLNISETETKSEEFESHKPEPDEVNENDDIHELAEKKEEDNAKVRRQDEDRSLLKLQDKEKQHSKRQNRQETNIPTPVQETGNEGKEKKKSVTMEIKNGYPKEDFDAEMGKGLTPNAAETETKPEEFESDEVDEVVEKKEEEEDNAKMRRRKIEDSNLSKKLQETKEQQQQEKIKELVEEKTPAAAETTVATQIPKPSQEIEEPEVGTCEEETKDQELYKPKVIGDDDDHHVSRKVGDAGQRDSGAKEEVDPEMGTPNISETETKAVEEDDMIHELVEKKKKKKKVRRQSEDSRLQEEKIKELLEEAETEKPKVEERLGTCEEKIFSEAETKDQESYRPKILECEDKIQELAEKKMDFSRKVEEEEETAEKKTELGDDDDDTSRKAQDIDAMKRKEEKEEIQEQVLEEKVIDSGNKTVAEAIHEEDEPGNQFQELIEGEKTSCQGEVKGVESEKNTREVDKRFREAQEVERTDSDDVSGIYGKGELPEEDDRLERGTGTIEPELVNLNSQMEQELEDENINSSCKEEESEIKTDDVIRKVQGVKEHELSEPKMNHGSKIKEMIEEKIGEVEKEDEVQESHEPNIRKERRCKTKITGTEEPSGQAREEEEKEKVVESRTVTEIKDQRPDKPESHEKRYKIQELVEAGHNEEQKDTVKAKQTSKGVQEIEQQESDGLSSSIVQEDKKQETEEKRTKTEDASLRKVQDDEDPEMSKSYKIQEPVEMGTSDYKEEVKKQVGDDTLRIQEPPDKPNLDELERRSEQGDKIHEPVEMRTHDDYREKFKKQDGDVDEEKVEDDSSDKFHEFEEQKSHEPERQEKRKHFSKESEEHEKTRVVEEKETLERKKTRSRDVQDDAEPELLKPYKAQQEDKKVHELMEKGTSDYREKVKKQDGNDTSISKEQICTVDEEKLESIADPGEKMEDDNSRKFHEPKSDDYWTQLEREKMKYLVKEEATGPKDKCTAEAGHSDHKEEQHEDITSEKVQEIFEKHKSDELQRSLEQDKMQEIEEKEKTKAMKENETVERRKKTEAGDKTQELEKMETKDYREKVKKQDGDDVLRSQETEKLDLVEEEATDPRDKHTGGKEEERYEEVAQAETKVEDQTNKEVEENQKEEEEEGSLDDPMTKIQEIEKEDSHDTEIQEKLNIVQEDFVEEETVDQEDEVAMEAVEANYDENSSRILQTIKEHEEHKEQRNGPGVEGEDEERIVEKEAYEEALDLKHTRGERYNDHKEEEKFIPKAEVKAEENSSEEEFDELQRSLVHEEMQETEEKGKPRSMEENETVEGRTKTEDDGSLSKVQEGEDPELSKHKRHEEELKKEDDERKIHQSVEDVKGEDKTLDQEDDTVGEAEAVVANNEKDSSRKLHTTIGGEELKQQEEIPDPRVKEGEGERVAEKETKVDKVHVQEPEVKTENEESRRGQKGKQEKNDETRSDDGIVRKVGETKVKESDEKKDPEPEEQIEEPERKEVSNDGVKLVTEEDSLTKGQEFIEKEPSERRQVGQENIQHQRDKKDAEKQEDEGKSDAGVEMQAKIKEAKGIEGSEKVAEVEMQANTGIIMKEHETKRQEPYELLEDEEHDKIPEPIVEGTKKWSWVEGEDEERIVEKEAYEEALDLKHTRGERYNDHKEEVKKQDGDVDEEKVEDDSSDKFHEFEEQNHMNLRGRRRENISSSGREGDSGEEEDKKVHELMEKGTSDYKEEVKKQDGNDTSISKEQICTVDEEEERYEEVAQAETKVEDQTNKEVEENQKKKKKKNIANYKEHEEHKEQRNGPGVEGEDEERIVEKEAYEEALDLKHTRGERYNDHKEEEKFIPKAEVKAEENSSEEEFDELQRSLVHEEMQETEEKGKPRSMEENETVEGRTKTEDDGSLSKVQEGEDPELSKHKRHEEELKKEDDERKIHQSVEDVKEKTKHWIKKMIRLETKVKESDEKKDPEPEEQIEEPERKEVSNDGVKLVTEEDSLTKGQEFIEKEPSERRQVGQENIQHQRDKKDAEKQEDEGKSDAGVEMQAKIKEAKGIEGSEKVAEVEMQANTGIIMKEHETKRQEPYELLEDEEHDKIPEPIVEGTKNQREEEKKVEDREVKEMKREAEELSEIQENQPVEEEEVNGVGGYKAVLKTKSMEDSSQTQDVEEKGPDHTEQENIQEMMAEDEEEELKVEVEDSEEDWEAEGFK
ncbi:hypothetical protein Bca52824_053171 [Brassica carinata]|uniref:SHSP domain-containing protein n=1 Tax=Brassica carinata TaxID=52824 RepID=A0A8X7R572_BRACI|nr:hypothetical protein Bca52824_053171 [Brassica carinata]